MNVAGIQCKKRLRLRTPNGVSDECLRECFFFIESSFFFTYQSIPRERGEINISETFERCGKCVGRLRKMAISSSCIDIPMEIPRRLGAKFGLLSGTARDIRMY